MNQHGQIGREEFGLHFGERVTPAQRAFLDHVVPVDEEPSELTWAANDRKITAVGNFAGTECHPEQLVVGLEIPLHQFARKDKRYAVVAHFAAHVFVSFFL